jgi:hypothetical protein
MKAVDAARPMKSLDSNRQQSAKVPMCAIGRIQGSANLKFFIRFSERTWAANVYSLYDGFRNGSTLCAKFCHFAERAPSFLKQLEQWARLMIQPSPRSRVTPGLNFSFVNWWQSG